MFKRLIGKVVVIELKNDLELRGTLHSVDQVCMDVIRAAVPLLTLNVQYLNFKLTDVSVVDEERFPHMVCILYLESCFNLCPVPDSLRLRQLTAVNFFPADVGQELLHPRLRCPLCATSFRCVLNSKDKFPCMRIRPNPTAQTLAPVPRHS